MPDLESYGVDEYGQGAGVRSRSRVGDIVFSPLGTPRAGTLVCDGSAVSRQTYKELFDFLGVSCGEGDGETTFNLPDLRDVWILCAGTEHEAGDSVAEGLPEIAGSYIACQINNSHAVVTSVTGAYSQTNQGSGGIANAAAASGTLLYPTFFNASRYNAIYGASDHVTPKSTVLTPCIIYE